MDKGISEIVGRAELAGGRSTQLYRSLRSLLCATCGAEIAEGTLFTRRRVRGIGVRIMPQCPECTPFIVQADKKEKSALLRALLADEPPDAPGRTGASARISSETASQAQREEKNIDEEVRRRLEPALKRSRRTRK